jgi:hypothetical protein
MRCKYTTENFVKKIADNYDIDVVTKADKNNSYEIFKDDRDYALKLEELSIKGSSRHKKQHLKAAAELRLLGCCFLRNKL